jgi:uncharacterized surface protein with fasciclin (FAS1) repeats
MVTGNKTKLAVMMMVVGLVLGGGVGYAMGAATSPDVAESSMNSNSNTGSAKDGVTVGGAKMVRELDIVDNAANAKNVSTVVSLVNMAGLVDTLKSEGPFTVFGPNNGAFEKIPAETVVMLQKPENKTTLTSILTYHVVSGTYTSADLKAMAGKGGTLTTVQGAVLAPALENNKLVIKDAKGGVANIETADVISSNGVTHVIDSVLMFQ